MYLLRHRETNVDFNTKSKCNPNHESASTVLQFSKYFRNYAKIVRIIRSAVKIIHIEFFFHQGMLIFHDGIYETCALSSNRNYYSDTFYSYVLIDTFDFSFFMYFNVIDLLGTLEKVIFDTAFLPSSPKFISTLLSCLIMDIFALLDSSERPGDFFVP